MKVQNLWGKVVMLGLVTLGAALILVYYYGAAGGRLPLAEQRYSVSAVVDEPQQLLKHADVRSAGVTVGEVAEITGRGSRARVKMDLERESVPVYADATVLVRQKTLVGENYIELVRGTPQAGALPDDSELPRAANQEAVPIDRVLNSLDATTRKDISTGLRAISGGVENRGQDLNRLFASLRPLTSDGQEITELLNVQRGQITNLLEQGSTVFEAVGDRSQDLQTLVSAAKTTAEAVSERDEQLKNAFAEFPSTLDQADGTVNRLAGFSGRATPVVNDLTAALTDLRPVLTDLRPTTISANMLLDELPRFTDAADPLLDRLKAFSGVAGPALPALDALLRQANPALKFLAPYNKDVTNLLQLFGSNVFYDRFGALGRCTCPVGDRTFANWTPALKQAADVLLDNGIVQQVQRTKNDHFAKPGTAGDAWQDNRFPDYPRVTAE